MLTFKMLWENFPDGDEMKKRCINKQPSGKSGPFENYCAILLSECLIKSGIGLEKCPGKQKCWSHLGPRHVLLADDLANHLVTAPPMGFGAREKVQPVNFQQDLSGRTGIVFFKDYWQRGNETFENRSGDHIDLWNKNEITGGSMMYRAVIEFFGFVSDLNKSKEIWFWEVK